MSVRVVDEGLGGSIGTGFRGRNNGNSLLERLCVGLIRILHLKGEMVCAGVRFDIGLAGCAGLIVFQDEVNLLSADLVPVPFEGKRGPGT